LFIETHPKTDEAMSVGPNMIPLGEMAKVLRSLLKIYKAAK
jgi:3-deoxy-D-manno-octulosonic acid (KDO) 8-phosphate synthase